MNRSTRHIVVLTLAVATAAVASFGVYRAISRIPVREVEVASSYVAVAARSLPPGVRLTEQDVRLAVWPAKNPVAGSHSQVKDVVNRALLAAVVENEPLVDGKLARPEAGAGLSPTIPQGMRAMAVKVNDVIGVAGFVGPGTRVDLVVTIRKTTESTSRTVVSNLQVLAAGTRAEQEKARTVVSGTAASAAVVTLLVSPSDAERIALAQVEGQIVLVLRNPLDTEPTTTTGVRSANIFSDAPPVAPVVTVPRPRQAAATVVTEAAPVRKAYTVQAIRAAKRTEEEVVR